MTSLQEQAPSEQRRWSSEDAVAIVGDGMRVLIGSGAAAPLALVEALIDRGPKLQRVEVCQLLTLGTAHFTAPELRGHLRHNAFFIGPTTRDAVQAGEADFTPTFLSEIPKLLRTRLPIDVALVQTTPPDAHGFCSLGVSVDIVRAAVDSARFVIAEMNPRMPRTHGDAFVYVSRFDRCVDIAHDVPELFAEPMTDRDRTIGRNVAKLIHDGDTIQVGIGAIPNAVLASLDGARDLGVHTEMFSDGVVDLVERGVITNRLKTLHPGKLVTSFVMGTKRVYDFVDDNPSIEMQPSDYVNDPWVVAKNHNMVAINSALSVDLTGQVCADSIGPAFYSGVGGQVDFIRGAARSDGGRSIIALPSTAKRESVSRIAIELTCGSGVTTTRNEVDYIVTEYGVAELRGKTVRERAVALVKIAHPKFRDALLEGARARRWTGAAS